MAYPPLAPDEARFDLSLSSTEPPAAPPGVDYGALADTLTPDEADYLSSLDPATAATDPAHQTNPLFQSILGKLGAAHQAPAPVLHPPDPRIPTGGALDAVKVLGLDSHQTYLPDQNQRAYQPPDVGLMGVLEAVGGLTGSPAGKFMGSLYDQPGNLPAALTAAGHEFVARAGELTEPFTREERQARRTSASAETEARFGPQPALANFALDMATDPANYIGGTPVDMVTALPHLAASAAGLALHPAILEKVAALFPNFAAVLRETVAGGGNVVRLGSLTRPRPVSALSNVDSLQAFKDLRAQGKAGAMVKAYKADLKAAPEALDTGTHIARGEALGASPADIAAFYVKRHGDKAEHVLPGARDFVRHLQQEGLPIHAGLWHDVMDGTPEGYTKVQSHFVPDTHVAALRLVEQAAQEARRAEAGLVRPAPPQLVGPGGQPVSSASAGQLVDPSGRPATTAGPRIVYTPADLSEGHLRLAPAGQNAQGDVRLSTRIPWAVKAEAPAARVPLTTDLATVREAGPAVVAKLAAEMRTHPLLTATEAALPDAEMLERLVEKMKDNLLWLWDRPEVQAVAPVTREWYVGAQVRAYEDAPLIGVTPEQVAASMAALSPKKDWHQNAELARRFGYTWRDLTDVNAPFDREVFDHYAASALEGRRGSVAWKKYTPAQKAADLAATEAQLVRDRQRYVDVHFADLPKDGRAKMIRAYAEVAFPTEFHLIRPTGEYGPMAMNADTLLKNGRVKPGGPAKLGWGLSQSTLVKALSALEDGRIVNLSDVVGDAHKVRSFYNNIIDPWYPGAVTIDTHAIAAAHLMPLSLEDREVTYAMGGLGDAMTGITGGNPIYAEAYNRAAKARDVLPREMQSVTWEALRGLFTPAQKSDKNFTAHIRALWDNYREQGGDLDALRDEILAFARKDSNGTIKPPNWTASADIE